MTGTFLDKIYEDVFLLQKSNKLSSTNAKLILKDIVISEYKDEYGESGYVEKYAQEKGYIQESNEGAIAAIVDEVLADPGSAQAVKDLKEGNEKVIGFLVGQVMKKSQGKANPELAQKLIRERVE